LPNQLVTQLPAFFSFFLLYPFFCWQLVAQVAALLALAAQRPRVAALLPLASAAGTYRRLFRIARDKCVVGTALLQPLGWRRAAAVRARMSIG
jgi:hypothetical protein